MARRHHPAAADVLAGRAPADPDLLARLIHRLNPTERGLPPAVEARRYAEKAALQSLLIERFPDAVAVVPHGGPRVVSLRLRGGRDAGHAPLDALSTDARAWVQRVLDTGGDADPTRPPAPAPAPLLGAADGLQAGRAALAAFDFEEAERHFEAAVEADPADLEAVEALLTLWVDTLVADHRALALGDRLPAHLRAEASVRGLLAVAAARAGELRGAWRWLEGLEGGRAGEAWTWLARAALQAEELRLARQALAALARVQPGAASLPALRDEVAVLAARLRAPAERALEQQMATGEPLDVVEAMARRLLDAHADSAVAARVLRAVGERRQAERLAVLVARAETEADAGRFGAAATLYREALGLGAPVAEALQQASARAEADRRRARVEAVSARLAEPDEAALLAWLALEPAEQALVEAEAVELVWLHQLAAPAAGAGAKEAVRAVRALAQARPLMTEAPATALALVEPYRARLAGLPDADRLLSLADEAIHLGRAARQRALLDAAAALLHAGDVAAALHRLDGLSVDGLGDAERERQARLRRHAELLLALDGATSPLDRRPLLADLVTLDSRFVSELYTLDAENARALQRVVFEEVGAPPAVIFAHGTRADARLWLTPAGDEAVLPDVRGPWLFLRWVAADRVRRAVRWRLPRAARLLDFVVEADSLRVLTEDRRVTTFSPDGLTLRRMDLLPGPPPEAAVLVPGSDHAWLADAEGVDVFAVSRRVRVRRLELGRTAALGTVGDAVIVRAQGTTVHAASGPRVAELGAVEGAVVGRDGAVVPLSAEPAQAQGLTTHGLRAGVAAGRRDGACFQLRLTHLWAGDLDWALNVPPDAELLRDAGADHVAVLVPDPAGLQLRLLDVAEPPPLTLSAVTRPGPEIQPWRARFGRFPVARLPDVLAAREALRTTPVVSWLVEARARDGAWADAVCYEVLRRVDAEAARVVADAARRAWPRSGLIGLLEAEPAAESGRWARARAALEGRTPEPEVALRFHRLLGFARLHTGGAPAALAAWQDGVAQVPEEAEDLDGLIAAVAPALVDGRPLDAPSVYAACMRALRAADTGRLAGDLAGIVDALDHPWTWHFGELQSLARLAEALLELPSPTPAAALRRHHALALFVDAAEGRLDLGPERRIALPLAAERWSAARVEGVAERARRWLMGA